MNGPGNDWRSPTQRRRDERWALVQRCVQRLREGATWDQIGAEEGRSPMVLRQMVAMSSLRREARALNRAQRVLSPAAPVVTTEAVTERWTAPEPEPEVVVAPESTVEVEQEPVVEAQSPVVTMAKDARDVGEPEDWLGQVVDGVARAHRYVEARRAGSSWEDIAVSEECSQMEARRIVSAAGLMGEARPARKSESVEMWWLTPREAKRRDREFAEAEKLALREAIHQERARRYADALIAGETLAAIGQREGVTRERVRQVVLTGGLQPEVDAAREARAVAAGEAYRAEMERRALDRKLSIRTSTREVVWTEAAIIEAVREWLDDGGSGSSVDWNAEGRSPSSGLIANRIGWAKAVRAAGGSVRHEVTRHRVDRWPPEAILRQVIAFLSDPDEVNGGPESFDKWSKKRGGYAPSASTVRNRFGGWGEAKRQALLKMAEEDAAPSC